MYANDMEFEEKVLPFLKEHASALVLGLIGTLCVGYGLLSFSKPQPAPDTQFQSFQNTPMPEKNTVSPIPKQITIDIEGAVIKPGVYQLPLASRMKDALVAAGGLSESADRKRVALEINLAQPLMDGAKLYIPVVGEQVMTSGMSSGNGTVGVQGSSTTLVNINQASESELDALPGVGPVTAQKIISGRPYQSAQELLDKKIVGQSVFTKIKDQISVY